MVSAATKDALTTAPFLQIYGGRIAALLADDFFTTYPLDRLATQQDVETLAMPNVIQMPNRAQFDAVLAQWLHDIAFDSLPHEMKDHDSFQELVEGGKRVVPLIASSLRKSPSFLFLALEEIFDEDPVPENAYGNLSATVASWLQWLQR